jgi:3-phenylpropionate/trans-cinnamate dioxygenase ferredoxin component
MPRWIRACAADDIEAEDVLGVTIDDTPYAIYRSADDEFYATHGLCTHARVRLADGLVIGHVIECPKHNGRFDYRTGQGKGAPICENLRTYPVRRVDGHIHIEID